MRICEAPRVLLVGSWGSEALVSAFTDVLYRGVELGEAL
ncbi:MAG: thymidylate synthase (FAD), partial [Pyrobaculum sp.]